jgi:TonB-linked SusC/RagA family outer membrane protein
MYRRVRSLISFLVALVFIPGAGEAQQTGTITGRVTSESGRPLSDTRVQVVGTTRGTLSAEDGSYRITAVQAGNVQVRATRLGFTAQTRTVSVRANASNEQNFSLAETATTLDEVIVTATGESQRRRESGASVGTIDTSKFSVATTPLLSNILSSRVAGVTVQTSGGTTGAGSRVRIRGSNSINLSNEPLIIVDGARVNNSPQSASIGVGGQVISRLEDFNPEDIETLDIIKGPAAAALYGTAAANGVIQITTKKGRSGATRWNWYEEYGTVKDVFDYPSNYNQIGTAVATGASQAACTLERQVLNICTPKTDSLLSWNPIENVSPFRAGWRMTHGLNTAGGSENTTFYVGGEFEREQGVYEPNRLRRISGRSNVRMQLRPDLDASLSIGVLRNRISLPINDNSAFGAISAGFLGKAFDCSVANRAANPSLSATYLCATDSLSRGYFSANIPSTQYFVVDNTQQLDRLTGSLQSNYAPLSWLRGVGLLSMDVVNRLDESLTPPNQVFFSPTTLEGSRFQGRTRIPTYTASGSLTATYDVPGMTDVRGQSTAGGQYVREDFRLTSAQGAVLLPGTSSLNGTSARFVVTETNQEVISLGTYLQQQLTRADRLFLTVAVRLDRNSAFGTSFKTVPYPAASVSWVASDESFFPRSDVVDQLRIRAAWGQSGQRPVFRDAATFFSPVSVRVGTIETPAFTVGGTGSPKLKPEVSTEFEGGLEGSFFKNRLSLELTGYTKTTQDAIVARRLAPSLGVTASQLVNLGEVSNKGVEALATVKLLDLENVEWNTTITASSNRNKLNKLGESFQEKTPILFGFGSTQQHREGYPLGGYFERRIVSYQDLDNNGIITRINCPTYAGTANPQLVGGPQCEVVLSDSVEYLGSPLPTREFTFATDVGLWRYARVTALLDYRAGFRIFNSTTEFRCTLGVPNCREVYDQSTPLSEQARVMARYMGDEVGYIEDASFVKFRELALQLSAPRSWAQRARVSAFSVTFAGRNLATWTDYTGLDPEVNANANAANQFTTSDFLTQPPVRYFVTRLNVNF